MSVLIFRLNEASEQEAQDVRDLLSEHEFEYYESSAGRWGLSVAGLWLHDESRKGEARALIDDYQRQRSREFDAQRAEQPSFAQGIWQRFCAQPLGVLSMLLLAAAILFISLSPFLSMAD